MRATLIQRAVRGARGRDLLGRQRRAAARQDHIRRERAYISALDARMAELNTTLAGGAASRYLGGPATDPKHERDACETELAELEDRYGPRPAANPQADREAG